MTTSKKGFTCGERSRTTLLPFDAAQGKRGFTLLELLIVIAILAILASITFVALNPAELLKKARDSQRISDLASMRTAINYYVVNVSDPEWGGQSATTGCFDDATGKTTYSHVSSVLYTGTTASSTTTMVTDGTGWIHLNLSALPGGSPLAKWPIDPNPTTATASPSRYYAYLCNHANTTFTLYVNMESMTYKYGGSGDVESKDGGSIITVYEVGTAFLGSTTSSAFYPG